MLRAVSGLVKPWALSNTTIARPRAGILALSLSEYHCFDRTTKPALDQPYADSRSFSSSSEGPTTTFVRREKDISELQKAVRQLYKEGNFQEALEGTHVLCEKVSDHFGRFHPVFASTLNDQALMLKSQGQYEDSVQTYMEALEVYRKAYKGEENASFAGTLHNLGMVFRAMADQAKGMERLSLLERTKESFQRALEIREKLLHRTHPDVQLTRSRLAMVRSLLPRGDGAEPEDTEAMLRAAVENLLVAAGGAEDASAATAMTNLALFLKGKGRFEEALKLYEAALEMRTELFGPNHIEVIVSMYNKAEALRAMGDEEASTRLQEEIVAIVEDLGGEEAAALENEIEGNEDVGVVGQGGIGGKGGPVEVHKVVGNESKKSGDAKIVRGGGAVAGFGDVGGNAGGDEEKGVEVWTPGRGGNGKGKRKNGTGMSKGTGKGRRRGKPRY